MGFETIETGYCRHDRITKDGRRLWYDLRVIQQPERARACGSGPKSSADRRPVDPPPVVELHIYEGEDWAHKKDITFTYNANFFLFATLEHARVMAHGRVQTPLANTPPVLSGLPVSGMAYLDRPNEAGYFLFPDLSVRHEGRYRLAFNLYEQTKEGGDEDAGPQDQSSDSPYDGFHWRMQVHSVDFSVFSAKKFPGLTESTPLSRTVAEQGCRVRIRRDVRMRRRDGKPGGDYDNVEEDMARRRRTQTPESVRARSLSNHSLERTPYGDGQRRSSGVEYPPPPPPPMAAQPPAGYLHFGSHSAHQYPQYPSQPQPASALPPSPSYPTGSYSPSSYPPPPPQTQPYKYAERPPSQPYRPAGPHEMSGVEARRPSDQGYRRLSIEAAPTRSVPALLPESPRETLPELHSVPDLDHARRMTQSASRPAAGPSSAKSGQHKVMAIDSLLTKSANSTQIELPYDTVEPLSGPAQGDVRGVKRHRDDSDPGQLKNGARQRDDVSAERQSLMPFKRANGNFSYVQSLEQRDG